MQTYPRGEVVLVLDCADLDRAADFWSTVLGYRRAGVETSVIYLSLVPENGQGPELLLQKVPGTSSEKNRVHLDLRTPDLIAEVQRVVNAGATLVTRDAIDEGGWRWHILADPDGNEFCVLQPPASHWSDIRPSAAV
ncbi:MAG TPA: VOC family protein [Kineosporiaceae bacterium]|nr:VOC family protein [Kineosporiaceae bacterium]